MPSQQILHACERCKRIAYLTGSVCKACMKELPNRYPPSDPLFSSELESLMAGRVRSLLAVVQMYPCFAAITPQEHEYAYWAHLMYFRTLLANIQYAYTAVLYRSRNEMPFKTVSNLSRATAEKIDELLHICSDDNTEIASVIMQTFKHRDDFIPFQKDFVASDPFNDIPRTVALVSLLSRYCKELNGLWLPTPGFAKRIREIDPHVFSCLLKREASQMSPQEIYDCIF